jgi:hypothetical protein
MIPQWLAWTFFWVLGGLSLLLIVGNWVNSIWAMRRKRSYSWIPLIGGLSGFAALLLCPWPGTGYWCWVPLVADLSIPGFLYAVFVLKAFRK